MIFKISRKKEKEPDYVEITALSEEAEISVKVDSLNEPGDIARIQNHIRSGKIVFAKISELRERDISELKRCIDRIKKTCAAIGGDIVGLDKDFLIITPSNVKIVK